jgi:cyclic pyranopterin phosphate synthase
MGTETGGLSHVDERGQPCMVDVSNKAVTARSATASARVVLPPHVFALIERRESGGVEIIGAKGAVCATAIIAGTMGAKRTSSLLPFCHPLPVEHVQLSVEADPNPAARTLCISCTVRTTGKTGVEMEALSGASIAALCIYDMLKALSHDIVISDVRLERKTGGKSDIGTGLGLGLGGGHRPALAQQNADAGVRAQDWRQDIGSSSSRSSSGSSGSSGRSSLPPAMDLDASMGMGRGRGMGMGMNMSLDDVAPVVADEAIKAAYGEAVARELLELNLQSSGVGAGAGAGTGTEVGR